MKAREFKENLINSNIRCLILAFMILLVNIILIVSSHKPSIYCVITGAIMVLWIIESAIRIDEISNKSILNEEDCYYDR